jgi:hypothetical protein
VVPLVIVVVSVMLLCVKEHVRPNGDTVAERATVPVKPSWLLIRIVEDPVEPAGAVTLVGLVTIVKSCMV